VVEAGAAAAARSMVYSVETPVERLSWTRTIVVAIAAAGFLFVAEPIAAVSVLVFARFSPGCGSGGNPNSCPSSPSDFKIYLLMIALASVTTIGLTVAVRLCLGRYGLILGWPRLIACSTLLVVVPPISLAAVVTVDRTQHVSGRASLWIPVSVAVVVGLFGVGVIRWLTNGRGRRTGV
jgi:hypothetical protein